MKWTLSSFVSIDGPSSLAGPISQIRAAEVSYKITNQDVTADYG